MDFAIIFAVNRRIILIVNSCLVVAIVFAVVCASDCLVAALRKAWNKCIKEDANYCKNDCNRCGFAICFVSYLFKNFA
mgnify:FL=1